MYANSSTKNTQIISPSPSLRHMHVSDVEEANRGSWDEHNSASDVLDTCADSQDTHF